MLKKTPRRRGRTTDDKPNWQRSQKQHAVRKWVYRIGFTALSLAILFSSIQLFTFINHIKSPLSAAPGTDSQTEYWSGSERLTTLFLKLDDRDSTKAEITDSAIIIIDPLLTRLTIVSIPVTVSLNSGQLNNTSDVLHSVQAIRHNVSRELAIPIDRYLVTDVKGMTKLSKDLGYFPSGQLRDDITDLNQKLDNARSIFGIKTLKNDIAEGFWTDLSLTEINTILKRVKNLSTDNIELNVLSGQFLQDKSLPDKRSISTINTEAFDEYFKEKLSNPDITEEHVKIDVLNATSTPGMAVKIARYIENSGGEIINLGNHAEKKEYCYIQTFIENPDESYTVRYLTSLFRCPVEAGDPTLQNRADIVFVIGTDMLNEGY